MNLGHVPETRERDAVHVAIVPLTAACDLLPGQHVGLDSDSKLTPTGKLIGIVDPYRVGMIRAGTSVYLCLYPDTVVGMRHEWQHPAFMGDHVKWLTEFAERLETTYEELMEVARRYDLYGTYEYDNSEAYKLVTRAEWREFWLRYSAATGVKADHDDSSPFTCSC